MDTILLSNLQDDYINKRIDKILAEILQIPRNQIQQLIKNGNIRVCEKEIPKSYRIRHGDCISITVPETKEITIQPCDAPIRIKYEDEQIVVVEKPAGVVVHPGAAQEKISVVSALLYRNITLSSIGAPLRPGVVHRIDKDTSGVIVLAKTDKAHFHLARQFFEHTIDRIYLGITSKHIKDKEGIIDLNIGRHPANRKMFAVVKNGKEAKTYFRVLKRLENYDVVMFKLLGRTHQIRVHMKSLGCPLLGDETYGKRSKLIQRQALHAFKLGFIHPATGKKMVFYSKLPEDLKQIITGG